MSLQPVRLAITGDDELDPSFVASIRSSLNESHLLVDCSESPQFILTKTSERWELHDQQNRSVVFADFIGGASGHRRQFGGGRGQAIARACGLKGGKTPVIIDATAGLGRDAFVLASLGCELHLFERSAVVRVLLGDAIKRARIDPETHEIAERMTLHQGDARTEIVRAQDQYQADTVYLDPMFPERRKSAAVKKEMRCFQQIVGGDDDAVELLDKALETAAKRVTVKRPTKSDPIGKRKPHSSVPGKTTRFDLYFPV